MKEYMKIALFAITVLLVAASLACWFLFRQSTEFLQTGMLQNTDIDQTVPKGMKEYRNDEWGFSFFYNDGWEIREPAFGSTVSLFNLSIQPTNGQHLPDPVLINITPKYWIDRILDSESPPDFQKVSIGGMNAITYESLDMGIPTINYFLLIDEMYWFNIAGKIEYKKELKQVIDSFEIFSTTTSIMQ